MPAKIRFPEGVHSPCELCGCGVLDAFGNLAHRSVSGVLGSVWVSASVTVHAKVNVRVNIRGAVVAVFSARLSIFMVWLLAFFFIPACAVRARVAAWRLLIGCDVFDLWFSAFCGVGRGLWVALIAFLTVLR